MINFRVGTTWRIKLTVYSPAIYANCSLIRIERFIKVSRDTLYWIKNYCTGCFKAQKRTIIKIYYSIKQESVVGHTGKNVSCSDGCTKSHHCSILPLSVCSWAIKVNSQEGSRKLYVSVVVWVWTACPGLLCLCSWSSVGGAVFGSCNTSGGRILIEE